MNLSSAVNTDAQGTTWTSQDDIVKDLALLNDFGIPGDTQPYKVLYSNGRGSEIKPKTKHSGRICNLRTGEVIDIYDEEFDINFGNLVENKGRGRLLSSHIIKNSQLQEQLRQARPLGSGDEIIESYCRRNIRRKSPTGTSSDCSPQPPKEKKTPNSPFLNFVENKQRVKGSRNSTLQCNILINSLLSKAKENPNATEIAENKDLSDNNRNKNFVDFSEKQTSDGVTANFIDISEFPPLGVRKKK